MEPQTTMAIPTEDGGLELWCGTQFPAFTQLTVCQLLGLPAHQVNIKVRRVGGAFGGKLSRQGPLAAACSLAALKSRRPIFGCNERLTDMRMTQGREQCEVTYSATCDNDGRVESLEMDWHIDVGWDGTDAAGDIAMLVNFSDNAFYTPNFKCNSTAYKSHTVPRTSVRAPGVIQSITAHEVIMEHVSRSLGLDFEWVQEKNFYQPGQKTPWGDVIGSDAFNWTMPQVWAKLREDSSFDLRRQAVERFNAGSRWRKRGIAMTPVKYGMGLDVFQAMATVCIFSADGTVLVNHNGCEIGQGIHTKVAQVVAYSLGLDLSMVRIADTESNQAPNTAATGGSGTSETSAQAARVACEELSKRLAPYLAKEKDWVKALAAAATDNVSLSAQGWYVHEKAAGLNSYATYGAAVSEVEIDVLTGEMEILRADILMDLGQQLNAAVDVGQLEGGFVMSLGFFFTEQVLFNDEGQLLNVGTWEYKIPSYCEVPQEFNVALMTPAIPNPNGVLGSKASAEPPMSLANSAYFAVKFAIYAARAELGQGNGFFQLPLPCTVEEIQRACALDDEAFRMSS
ncbi:unnamed protein product [Polarella glacialis]|uniref:Xanthine dehydrogenase n=1 Tax=Polarella glacialis TaxID=89957 RepID=A0A813KRV0_POLGL|nr:unnamed protein product [Polarella glacialis]